MDEQPRHESLIVITGLSGAGNSTALHSLADAGLYCIDNLPMELLSPTVDLIESGRIHAESGLAICMDVRNPSFAERFPAVRRGLSHRIRMYVVFMTADSQVIATRFGATRRKHPLLQQGETLLEAIEREREMLSPVEESADLVMDTSNWSPQQLARALEGRLVGALPARLLHVSVTSFGFKYGQLEPVDMLFDVRFLDNPFFVPSLKRMSGLELPVRDYVFSRSAAGSMLEKMQDMLRFLLPLYYSEGKHYFRIGIGCTGGRHRSVAFAEEIGRIFFENPIPHTVMTVIHRDIER
jgi:UPF0042 nucleotide-binding protein